jgi:hypothetical protein
MITKLKTFLRTPLGRKLEHTFFVFASAFAVTAYGNRDHLLAAHGLDGVKAAGYAVAVAAAYAGFAKVRPLLLDTVVKALGQGTTPAPPTQP